ncbi:MAG: BtpA/SgcQ family protein [Thermoplasmatota archaeon]
MLGFSCEKPVIGVIHLEPLPGSPCFDSMKSVLDSALKDAENLMEGGVDGIIIENFGDKPFVKKVSDLTVSSMSVVIDQVSYLSDIPIGINVLRNDWKAALSIVKVLDLDFVRINVYSGIEATPEGLIEGEAGKIQRFRENNEIKCFIMADIHVKHGEAVYPKNIEEAAVETAERGLADALIVSGDRTGNEVDSDQLKNVKSRVDIPVFIGSGINKNNVNILVSNADGAIVGTYFKEDGEIENSVSLKRVKDIMGKMDEIR